MMQHPQFNPRKGLSLVEVAVSSLLVGTVVVGSLSMMGAAVRTQQSSNDQINGPRLADELMAEILSMPYKDPDVASGGGENDVSGPGRTGFDDVYDYDGWNEPTIQDKYGNPLPNSTGWSRTAEVWKASRTNGNVVPLGPDTGLFRTLVCVTAPDGSVTKRRAMRSQWGVLEQPPTMDKMVVSQVEAALAIGTAGEVQRATNLLNHVEDPN